MTNCVRDKEEYRFLHQLEFTDLNDELHYFVFHCLVYSLFWYNLNVFYVNISASAISE